MNLMESHAACEMLSPSKKYAVFFGAYVPKERARFYRVFRVDTGETVRAGQLHGDPYAHLRGLLIRGYRRTTQRDLVTRYPNAAPKK